MLNHLARIPPRARHSSHPTQGLLQSRLTLTRSPNSEPRLGAAGSIGSAQRPRDGTVSAGGVDARPRLHEGRLCAGMTRRCWVSSPPRRACPRGRGKQSIVSCPAGDASPLLLATTKPVVSGTTCALIRGPRASAGYRPCHPRPSPIFDSTNIQYSTHKTMSQCHSSRPTPWLARDGHISRTRVCGNVPTF